MKYVIAIPAFLACIFYVYVLVQLRRDEKHHRAPANPEPKPERRGEKLVSFAAVRPLGGSFAQWSRLAKKRGQPGHKPAVSKEHGPDNWSPKSRSIGYVEIGLPLSAGVAPITDIGDEGQTRLSPKKIA